MAFMLGSSAYQRLSIDLPHTTIQQRSITPSWQHSFPHGRSPYYESIKESFDVSVRIQQSDQALPQACIPPYPIARGEVVAGATPHLKINRMLQNLRHLLKVLFTGKELSDRPTQDLGRSYPIHLANEQIEEKYTDKEGIWGFAWLLTTLLITLSNHIAHATTPDQYPPFLEQDAYHEELYRLITALKPWPTFKQPNISPTYMRISKRYSFEEELHQLSTALKPWCAMEQPNVASFLTQYLEHREIELASNREIAQIMARLSKELRGGEEEAVPAIAELGIASAETRTSFPDRRLLMLWKLRYQGAGYSKSWKTCPRTTVSLNYKRDQVSQRWKSCGRRQSKVALRIPSTYLRSHDWTAAKSMKRLVASQNRGRKNKHRLWETRFDAEDEVVLPVTEDVQRLNACNDNTTSGSVGAFHNIQDSIKSHERSTNSHARA